VPELDAVQLHYTYLGTNYCVLPPGSCSHRSRRPRVYQPQSRITILVINVRWNFIGFLAVLLVGADRRAAAARGGGCVRFPDRRHTPADRLSFRQNPGSAVWYRKLHTPTRPPANKHTHTDSGSERKASAFVVLYLYLYFSVRSILYILYAYIIHFGCPCLDVVHRDFSVAIYARRPYVFASRDTPHLRCHSTCTTVIRSTAAAAG